MPVVADARERRGQSGRVRMPRMVEDLAARPLLDDAPRVHHSRSPADVGQRREVVCDEDHRERELPLKSLEQLENLGLHHDVERSRRLVGERMRGLHASASAMRTRWRCPPESWCG